VSRGMRITEAEFDAHQAKHASPAGAKLVKLAVGPRTGRPNKYGAIKTTDADSRKESRRLGELRLMQKGGLISCLVPQVTFLLLPAQVGPDGRKERAVTYTCDAIYVNPTGLVVEDTKSDPTRKLPAYILRRKLMLSVHGIQIKET
jgi:Protein of unknown function (DUF1064)